MKATSVGASATVVTQSFLNIGDTGWFASSIAKSSDSDTIDTTGTLVLNLAAQYSTSNGANYVNPFTYQVEYIPAP